MSQSQDVSASDSDVAKLPSEVLKLQPRMRQIAEFVYLNGGATVIDVHNSIGNSPSIYGVRTMLIRLARKGILKCRKSGRHMSVLYYPAIGSKPVKELAVRSFLDKNFSGSAPEALQVLLQMGAVKDANAAASTPSRKGSHA